MKTPQITGREPSCCHGDRVTHLSREALFLGLQLTEGALKLLQLTLQPWHFPLGQQLLLLLHTLSTKSMWKCRASNMKMGKQTQ